MQLTALTAAALFAAAAAEMLEASSEERIVLAEGFGDAGALL